MSSKFLAELLFKTGVAIEAGFKHIFPHFFPNASTVFSQENYILNLLSLNFKQAKTFCFLQNCIINAFPAYFKLILIGVVFDSCHESQAPQNLKFRSNLMKGQVSMSCAFQNQTQNPCFKIFYLFSTITKGHTLTYNNKGKKIF